MGKKIKPVFSIEDSEEQEQEQFEGEVQNADYEKAIRVCRSPSDKRGHSRTMNFRCLPYYFRLGSEILTKEPRFGYVSDVHRTALNLGYKEILLALKGKKKIGTELDDLMSTVNKLEDEMNSDQAFRHFEARLKRIGKSLAIYSSDKEVFRKKVERYKKEIEALSDPFWRKRLRQKFMQAMMSLDDSQSEDMPWEDDSDL
jgi:hypothetical protein